MKLNESILAYTLLLQTGMCGCVNNSASVGIIACSDFIVDLSHTHVPTFLLESTSNGIQCTNYSIQVHC